MTPTKQTVYLESNSKKTTHFLSAINEEAYFRAKEQEGYFFTPEQLNQFISNVIKDTLDTAAENANLISLGSEQEVWNSVSTDIKDFVVNKQSITNTFEEVYNKLKV